MKIPYLDLGWRSAGARMVVSHDGNQAFVELLDSNNFQMLSQAQSHNYFGGMISGSEWAFEIPYDGNWYVAGAGDGQLRVDDVLLGAVGSPGIPAPRGQLSTNADDLIASVTDHSSGDVDTNALAAMVADAFQQDPGRAEAAYAELQVALASQGTDLASRLDEDVSIYLAGVGSAVFGTGQGAVNAGRRILADNPLLRVMYEFTDSPWDGKGGATPGMLKMVQSHSFEVVPEINRPPAGGIHRNQGISAKSANPRNGALARDAIAARQRAQYGADKVRAEAPIEGHPGKKVDVEAHVANRKPWKAEVHWTESKAGRQSPDARMRAQADVYSDSVATNRALRAPGQKLIKYGGKVLRPLGLVMDAVAIGEAIHEDGNRFGEKAARTTVGVAGGAGGALAGAAWGAALGSAVPVVGTLAGALVGGAFGGLVGTGLGEGAYDLGKKAIEKIKDWRHWF